MILFYFMYIQIVPQKTALGNASNDMGVGLPPYSVTSFDLSI